ncbi:MAG TPA: GNAT family N-acetyltransferase [Polyangiaceae bacterium]|jgi:ribosomal protein S18 acetylase RimI-like enzyme|nr:GNAT family N-acetyltransferase [Polyangiaceae bacterium]
MGQAGPIRADIDRSLLEIRPFGGDSVSTFATFTCGDDDLDDFIRTDALRLQSLNVARSYVAWYEGQARGYVTLMSDAVVLKPNERKKLRDGSGNALAFEDHPVVPALKIARLAVCKELRASHRGIGEALVRFAFYTGLDMSEAAGCRLLTLDAYPDALPFYEKLGFTRNLDTAYGGKPRPSMRLDLFAPIAPSWL